MAASLHVAIRTFHVLGMAILLGGAAALWYAARSDDGVTVSAARHYEWAFWGVLGVMVVTGIGNLGALGAPGPDTRWGTILLVKLVVVVAFVVGSVVRTLALARFEGTCDATPFCQHAYSATTGVLLALVVLAEVLAHG